MTEKLRKCPMCGKDVAEICNCKELEDCTNFEECGDGGWSCVVCNVNKGGCGASGGYADSKEKAILKWNTRAADENPPLTLDELKEMEDEPVYIVFLLESDKSEWKLLGGQTKKCTLFRSDYSLYNDGYSKTWLAYRRKPEELNSYD